jgi:hypothetical protein
MKLSNSQLPLSNKHLQNQLIKLSIIFPLRNALQRIIESLITSNELQIWQTYDRFGKNWWHAYDPVTGQHTSVDSEAELRAWIEKRYYK